MATGIFDEKNQKPSENDLEKALKSSMDIWERLIEYLRNEHEVIETEWKFYSKNAGWCLKVYNEKGKNIVFLSPNNNYFYVTINMSTKIKENVLEANISEKCKKAIGDTQLCCGTYAVLFTINNIEDLEDIKTILSIRDK